MVMFPLPEKVLGFVGCVTMIGTGDTVLTIAAVPLALIVVAAGPSKDISVVVTFLCTVTRSNVAGLARGAVGTPTAAAVGKSKDTVSLAELNPFKVCA